jgi:hypothetical protein
LKTLFLAWQDPNSRSWFPIGRLTFDGVNYQFFYTQGALEAKQKSGFAPLSSFPSLDEVYTSTHLFSVLSNRLMPKKRPDYSSFLQWLNIPSHEDDPMALLARSGGQKQTDTLTVFPSPEPDEKGQYHLHFFGHGLRYLPSCAVERINRFVPGEKLWLAHEFQNSHDPMALTLNTKDHYLVGYCPRYLNPEIFELLGRISNSLSVEVEQVNQPPTPLQFRLLCHLTAKVKVDDHFCPFSTELYQPLVRSKN